MEVWKDIPNYEGMYQVSDLGRVKSLKRKGCKNDKILKNNTDNYGYLNVNLSKNKVLKTFKVHKIVAIMFLGHEPNGHKIVVDHIDNDKSNNKLSNLQLITQRENLSKDCKDCASKYIGVSWSKASNKWLSRILINGKPKFLGSFIDELDAAEAYQKELKKINI